MSRQPTRMDFVGVTTAQSAALRMFPAWARILGRPEVELHGIDLALDAPRERYRALVTAMREQPAAIGALITSHKLNLMLAAADLFDELTNDARLAGEVSCIYRRGEHLIGHAVDIEAIYQVMSAMTGPGYWSARRAHILCLGAGGSAAAMLAGLFTRLPEHDRPEKIILVDRSLERLDALSMRRAAYPETSMVVETHLTQSAQENDTLLERLPPSSLVVNATGMGKDLPGSPLSAAGRFPQQARVWDLNYRGRLEFLEQARRQESESDLRVFDGWELFVIGWALVCARVLDVDPFGERLPDLKAAAAAARE